MSADGLAIQAAKASYGTVIRTIDYGKRTLTTRDPLPADPLVTVGNGEDSIHDWNYMLSGLGLLRHDQGVGTLAYLLGLVIIIASVFCCGYLAFQDEETGPD